MDFIFTGCPTKREIIIYLKNRKYSLINNTRLKRDIINFNTVKNRYIYEKKMQNINLLYKMSKKLQIVNKRNNLIYNEISHQIFFNIMKCKFFIANFHSENITSSVIDFFVLNRPLKNIENCPISETEMKQDKYEKSLIIQNKPMKHKRIFDFFDEISDDVDSKNELIDVSALVSPTKNYTSKLFEDKIELNSNAINFRKNNFTKQKKINLDFIKVKDNEDIKKIDFTYKKINNDKKKKNVLKEIDNNTPKKIKKTVTEDYCKILNKNTRINSGYKNVIVKYTEKIITSQLKTEKNRNQKVKFSDIEESGVHNLNSPVPIIKKSKTQNKTQFYNKRKEIIFIQNVDIHSYETEENF